MFLSQKSSTSNGIIRPANLLFAWILRTDQHVGQRLCLAHRDQRWPAYNEKQSKNNTKNSKLRNAVRKAVRQALRIIRAISDQRWPAQLRLNKNKQNCAMLQCNTKNNVLHTASLYAGEHFVRSAVRKAVSGANAAYPGRRRVRPIRLVVMETGRWAGAGLTKILIKNH